MLPRVLIPYGSAGFVGTGRMVSRSEVTADQEAVFPGYELWSASFCFQLTLVENWMVFCER